MPFKESQTVKPTYYKQLDGLRFLAVIAVMYCHWVALPGLHFINLISGSSGVNLFFVLSGFLITQILIKNKITHEEKATTRSFSLKQFYIRRVLRIFPIYYILILVTYVFNIKPCRDIVLWLLSYTGNIIWIIKGPAMGHFIHLWSLAVEEQYYLLFPFFILIIPKRYLFKSFIILIVSSVMLRFATYLFYSATLYPPGIETGVLMPCCLDSFGLGAILAYYQVFDKPALSRALARHWIYITAFLLFIVCSIFRCFPMQFGNNLFILFSVTFYRFSFSVCCFWIIGVASLQGFKGMAKLFLENKAVIYLGKISYGLYIYHNFMPDFSTALNRHLIQPVLNIFHLRFTYTDNNLLTSLWYFILTIIISTVSWYIIEKPINRLKEHFKYSIA